MTTAQRILAALLISLAFPASASFDLDALMEDLARRHGGRASFVETRYFALLDNPIVARGELTYLAPDRLEKRTRSPKPEIVVLEGDRLTIEREHKKLSIDLSQYPQAKAFVDSIRGTLTGNRKALEKNYLLHLSGNSQSWQLVLYPSDEKIAAFVQRIDVAGRGNRIDSIEFCETDGDRSVMLIEQIDLQ